MDGIVIAVAVLAVISLICGVMLSMASKFMAVEVDERIPLVRECLPGANCGACGFAGCDGYAAALVEDPELAITLCTPGGAGAAERIGSVLGRTGGETVRKVALVHCSGSCKVTSAKMDYSGIETCTAAKLLYGGTGQCVYGCAGLGDCVRVCPVDAIHVTDGLAWVDAETCIGCGLCVKACPSHIISMRPANSHMAVGCSSPQKGADVRKICSSGCIGCRLCERNCHTGAITVTDNLASVDYAQCDGCGKCVEVCPTKCLIPLNLSAAAAKGT